MKKDLITVIVPIYRVEKYLNRCIDSILKQTYKNLEIILVDDGSDDKCPEICDQYKQIDNRIYVIHKVNGGLSEARNFGLKNAKGKYVCFIDSDDYISYNMIEILYNAVYENDADISICNFEYYFENKQRAEQLNITKNIEISKIEIDTGEQAVLKIYGKQAVQYTVAWNKLYKKSLFANITYPVNRYHEDEFTTYKLLYLANKVIYVDTTCYYYLQRENSITSVFNQKRLDVLKAYDERLEYFKKNNLIYTKTFIEYLNILTYYYYKFEEIIDQSSMIKIINKMNNLGFNYKFVPFKMKIRIIIFKINKKLYKKLFIKKEDE